MDTTQGVFMPTIAPVTLPIEEFEWVSFDVDDTTALAPLVLPRLTSLDLREGVEANLFALHSRSAIKLNALILTFFELTVPGFSAFLRDMSSLTALALYQCISITDDFLECLVYNPSTRTVLPQLERLIMATDHAHFSERVMMRMIDSRWTRQDPPTPLVKVRLTRSDMVEKSPRSRREHSEVLDWVVRVVEAGLELDYSH
ncbi:hypothetical protein FB45DRAFT_1031954 [Roridomyces roridus]|uniref:Uncharacterized protein n=1 Tax=Roridomyces roridus TaxID=1738132 RepID=A0AAD7FG94_9AGAR|nr:hypothetical protein FB45DRAFT_1031954 [Roridomyces roridus]